ncbi:hypothetical protein ACFO25_16875 [Paenactinomyces guangxiensis]|uniref:Uncharacterized protein n=1 Tax=Paenactinomyces guangxiensis TaxID=1490290 RepID=A0A7W1WUS4_9BACL|nr:hypothetical protein [Paenactinomyces guangxiensis]MBA4496431.1 hypothetical protein [Paenactinomyces guangxiensis]MBH8593532.1 hypothetical protein [Paenactinomyces guangxiensis]
MLRLRVEGPVNQVKSFMRDFSNHPQFDVKASSNLHQNDYLENDVISSFCHFEYRPLNEIVQPISVTFVTPDGRDLSFALLRGKVIRMGDVVFIMGKANTGLLRSGRRIGTKDQECLSRKGASKPV